jgi:MFS family permease
MTTKPNPYTFREVLALPGVRPLWTAQLVSIAGDFLALIAVLSIATFRLHATPAQTTGVTIAYMLPLALFSPLAGVLVDRRNPRRVMIASDLLRALLAVLLVFATSLPEIYATLFAISTISIFFLPAQSVLVRTLVPRDALLSANAVMQQAMLVIRMLSPALAGALVAHFGPASCFYLDAFSFFISALMLWSITLAPRPQLCTRPTTSRAILTDLSAGIRFILTHESISFVMLAMTAATFAISCFSPLIAIFVRDILHADVRTFGVISTMTGLGMLAGTQLVRRCTKRFPPRQIVLFSLAVIAAGIVLIATSQAAAITAMGALTLGTGVGLLTVPAQTLIQSETPLPLLGRVSSAVTSLISVAQILGLSLSGVAAATLGLRNSFLTAAILLALFCYSRGAALLGCGVAFSHSWRLLRPFRRSQRAPVTETNLSRAVNRSATETSASRRRAV